MKERFYRVYYWFYVIILSIQWIKRINLGDTVIYDGRRHIVVDGVMPESWKLSGMYDDFYGWVPRNRCVKLDSLASYKKSFMSGYNFYMTSWHNIWVREGIKPWMRGCSIWP